MVGTAQMKADDSDFVYSAAEESSLAFNVINSFKTEVEQTA